MGHPAVSDEAKITMAKLVYFTDLSFNEIGIKCRTSAQTVIRYAQNVLSLREIDERILRLKAARTKAYLDRNPDAYVQVEAPSWYTGPVNGFRVSEHIINWCKANDATHVEAGYVVHHIDHNRRNNEPSNLQLMTAFDHKSYHSKLKTGPYASPKCKFKSSSPI